MASEYLKYIHRDVKPDPPPPPLTGKKKILNWLHYHKLLLVVIAVLVWVGGSIVWSYLGIGKVRPDYIVAYIGKDILPEECAASLPKALAGLGEDVNGDGQVVVELKQYAMERGAGGETSLYYTTAANTLLIADITEGDSFVFLVENPAEVQRAWQIFAAEDGGLPADDDYEAMDKVYQWVNCPVLTALDTEQETLSSLYIGRRGFYGDQGEGREADEAFYARLVEGAVR